MIFDDEQVQRINQFFALIRVGWGVSKFNSQFGDEEDIRHTKRFYAARILQYTPDKLAEAVDMGVALRGQGDEDFLFPDVAKILGLIGSEWEHTRQSRPAAEVLLDKPVDLGADRLIEHDVKPLTPADALAEMRAAVGLTEE